MKTIRSWSDLEKFGIVFLTFETQYLLCHTTTRVTAGAGLLISRGLWFKLEWHLRPGALPAKLIPTWIHLTHPRSEGKHGSPAVEQGFLLPRFCLVVAGAPIELPLSRLSARCVQLVARTVDLWHTPRSSEFPFLSPSEVTRMKTIKRWSDLEIFGIDPLTAEACSLGLRLLCDLTQKGKSIVEKCLSVEICSENWNSGSRDDPHVASIMLSHEMLMPLAVFALLESGCGEVWIAEQAAFGIEAKDTEEQVDMMKRCHKPHRRFAYHGPFQDRNQHQMSGRVR